MTERYCMYHPKDKLLKKEAYYGKKNRDIIATFN